MTYNYFYELTNTLLELRLSSSYTVLELVSLKMNYLSSVEYFSYVSMDLWITNKYIKYTNVQNKNKVIEGDTTISLYNRGFDIIDFNCII